MVNNRLGSEHMERCDWMFRLKGFSPQRAGYIVAFTPFAFLPIHPLSPCQGSGMLTATSVVFFVMSLVLSAFPFRKVEARFKPAGWAVLAVFMNMLVTH